MQQDGKKHPAQTWDRKEKEATTTDAPTRQPSNQGEQSVSGSTPDLESDDDTLANAQEAGEQLDENEEHPKEIDLGGDVDKAEKYHRTH